VKSLQPHPPLSPFPLSRGRGSELWKRGINSSSIYLTSFKEQLCGVFKRGTSPSFKIISPSLVREGDKGGRLLTDNLDTYS